MNLPSLRFGRSLLALLGALLTATTASAQYEIRAGAFNTLYRGTVPIAANNTPPIQPTQPQFAGQGVTAGGAGAISISATLTVRYPAQIYPAGGGAIIHVRSTFGFGFASAAARFLFGDIINSPTSDDAGSPLASNSTYWRAEPVKPGETFVHPEGAQDTVLKVAADATLNYYYSRHAEKVFASQSGRVAITWVSRVPVASGTDTRLRYRFRDETFAVSSATAQPTRTIFWTERSFSGPIINVPIGNIETVNPIYNAFFPATVAEEYQAVGVSTNTDPNATAPAEKRTLWFEKPSGIGQLRAYNLEGRILIEYLGSLKAGSGATHTFLGADIVEIVRVAPTVNAEVNLGDRITPRDPEGRRLPLNSTAEWLPSPVVSLIPDGQSYYGSTTRPDGVVEYYAERENSNPDRVVFYWLEQSEAAIDSGAVTNPVNLFWPKAKNAYAMSWPASLAAFAHNTVSLTGSTTTTGVQFPPGQLPQVVFQDDGAQTETKVDTSSQRLVVSFASAGDGLNRTLLRFSSGNEIWYVRLYTQADGRSGFQESDGAGSAFTSTATVGERVLPPSAAYSTAGHIETGAGVSDSYFPVGYIDPLSAGVTAAEQGAIIPVNAIPGKSSLKIWWLSKVTPPSPTFQPFYLPTKVGTYTVSYPASPRQIVLASNTGSGDLSPAEIVGQIYLQNNRAAAGFNPNEEHALMLNGRVYALRDDLNDTSSNAASYTSEPFVLLGYTAVADQRPAMSVFKVVRETGTVRFDYAITAGTIVPAPMPLPLLPLPLDAAGKSKNLEVPGIPDPAPHATAPDAYDKFTFKDRKGYDWVYRGPHATGSPTLGMQFYYTMREGFYVPGVATQPAIGTVLPYLRPLVANVPSGDPVTGTSLTVIYRPVWPESAPALRVAETLTLPKFGLPAVLPQASAQVFYQQSIATGGTARSSVVLHDPIREKTFALGTAGQLGALPASILTTSSQGKTFFQRLPPHLQPRFYYDPQRGPKGSLVWFGKFVDEIAGDDYLQLNVLSSADKTALENLAATGDANRPLWLAAIAQLTTLVETFVEDPAKAGSFKSDGAPVAIDSTTLATVAHADTAVVDYALTATGAGSGWVTLVFGNGRAFTPTGDPVSVQVFKVAPVLYSGDLKVLLAQNPLDEQVTLRHSGDFAAEPDHYEFEWRYAPPQGGVAPPIYDYAMTYWHPNGWYLAQNPAGALPTAAEYATTTVSMPRTVQINLVAPTGSNPGLVAKANLPLTFTGAVPQRIIFTADIADHTGFVLYVNRVPALAFQAPAGFTNTAASTGLVSEGLARQFTVDGSYFMVGTNAIEIALFSSADVGANSAVHFMIYTSVEIDRVAGSGSPWQAPGGTLLNEVVVGGSPTAPLGSPLLVMSDNYFTMRYRAKAASPGEGIPENVAGQVWSRWLPPQLVEGWIKRVLAGINPFNQRVSDLRNNPVDTDVSILTQAGKRWEGDIALSLENINDFGLIEIYETVLNRGKNMSIDSGYDYGAANDALLLAAGYLNDLYTVLGNEAYADAANPTISIDDSTVGTEVNTARFSFEGQVANVLEEELGLLRGRDDFLTAVVTTPAYNRLYWNYTRGINAGEALYATNYNIREKAGSPTADGKLDAADAQRMFPQGHGDAYGHYLTALTGYYRLLQNPNFTWTPRSEAVTVLGQSIAVDYYDERKFAEAGANLARTAQQVIALTHRQSYKDDPAAGWGHFRDGKFNSSTGNTRSWGLDEWASRSAQGAYYHWMVGNALLPDKDTNPTHTGVQIIDRTTVPALQELTTAVETFQSTMDTANAHLNPLGLSPGAIAFDISGAELKAGKSHYEQIYDRSLRAVLNAKGAFDQAAKMTRLLRTQENQLDSSNAAIVDQERAYVKQLTDLFGTPYPGLVGAGKIYAQGYAGPDDLTWFIIDRASDLVNTSAPVTLSVRVPANVRTFTGLAVADITNAYAQETTVKTVALQLNQYAQFSDVWPAGGASLGSRSVTGALQSALTDVHQAQTALLAGQTRYLQREQSFFQRNRLYQEMISTHSASLAEQDDADAKISQLRLVNAGLSAVAQTAKFAADYFKDAAGSAAEFPPTVFGLANDATSSVRASIKLVGSTAAKVFMGVGVVATNAAKYLEAQQVDRQKEADAKVEAYGFSYQQAQVAYEYELLYRELVQSYYEIAQLATSLQRSLQRVNNLMAEGERLKTEREIFRQRAAALIQGYRTKDLTFRTFRNEGLEQYRSLFDLASRYTYLAAKSYDYETGLLGSTSGQDVINQIVAARALGDLTGGSPQATVSTTGDAGLAGTMARLQADWSVAKGRLGINNPDQNGTLFSLRRELYRLLDDPARTDDDAQWQQTLEQHIMSNVLADPDVAAQCRNLRKSDGSAVSGIVIPFRTTIQHGQNFFGLPLADGDHAFTASNFATKIYSVGLVLRGYLGMDPYQPGTTAPTVVFGSTPNALSATPYVYLIPTGTDYMRAPPLGDTDTVRGWNVADQALPLPFNLGATAFSSTQFYNANGTLTEQPWILRKHQAFRPVSDPTFFYSTIPAEFTSSRLVGRSAWNGGWKIVIPAYMLYANEQEGLNRLVASVKDIELFLRTYSHSGN